MSRWLNSAVCLAALCVSGCGGSANLTCDEIQPYQEAAERPRVRSPEDLDALDPLREMAVPEASPQAVRPPGSACIDRPPAVNLGS